MDRNDVFNSGETETSIKKTPHVGAEKGPTKETRASRLSRHRKPGEVRCPFCGLMVAEVRDGCLLVGVGRRQSTHTVNPASTFNCRRKRCGRRFNLRQGLSQVRSG